MSIYSFDVETINKELKPLKDYQGSVLLIVNTASKCGFTPQFTGLEDLYEKYQDQDFTVLGFPCNQFLRQDPKSSEEILSFCQLNYQVTFPMFAKIAVKGKNQAPLFNYLVQNTTGKNVEWNFTKFLINRQGEVVQRFGSKTTPEALTGEIEKLL
ncbi:glutathione peroxidase [Vagococcus salmoninarum]|uniref:glutathione peroxidase n=1 Tax=Vagococcus salmoninarum TaxID=2739 RepID=UPI0028D69D29|nr:glutathione peroxidase [Vagococcus salmoninarum]